MAGKKKQNMRQKPEPMAVLVQIYLGLLASVFVLYPGFRGYVAIDQAKYGCFLALTGGYVGLSLLLLAACGAAVLWYCMQVFFGFSLVITAPLFWAVWALAEKEIKHETQIRRT